MNGTPQLQLRNLLMGGALTQALQTAAELGVADALAEGSKDCAALAAELEVRPDGLRRLLRVLSGCGVFEEDESGRFANSRLSHYLRGGRRESLRDLALAYGDSAVWRAWEGLTDSIRRGGSAFEHVHRAPLFDHLQHYPETARRFDAAMASSASLVNDALASAHAWDQYRHIVDVGGGSGATLLRILAAAPQANGIVYDLPHAAQRAAASIAQSDAAERCMVQAGDFFSSVPPGGDAYLLKHILHDWNDETCVRLLNRCHEAMDRGAVLLVCERLLTPENHYVQLTDLVMLALTKDGRERTEQEYVALFHAAGFTLQSVCDVTDELVLMRLHKSR